MPCKQGEALSAEWLSAFRGFQGEEVLKEDADKEQKEPDEHSFPSCPLGILPAICGHPDSLIQQAWPQSWRALQVLPGYLWCQYTYLPNKTPSSLMRLAGSWWSWEGENSDFLPLWWKGLCSFTPLSMAWLALYVCRGNISTEHHNLSCILTHQIGLVPWCSKELPLSAWGTLLSSLVLTHTHTHTHTQICIVWTFLQNLPGPSHSHLSISWIPKEPIVSSARDFVSLPKELEGLHQ